MASPVKTAKAQHAARGFTEVAARGKGYLRSKKPGSAQYALTAQAGGSGWHFGSAPFDASNEVDSDWILADPVLDAPWKRKMIFANYNAYIGVDAALNFNAGQIVKYIHPLSQEAVSFQPMQLQWSNDLDQISAIQDPQTVSAIVAGDTLTWLGAYGPGLNFRWQAQTTRLFKALDIANLAYLGAPPQFIIDGGNPFLNLEMIFQKSAAIDIYVDGVLWDEKVNNPVTTGAAIEFKLSATGETVWFFNKPLVWDQRGNAQAQLHARKSGQSLLIQVRTPWAWLQAASYPVVVDVTIDDQVGVATDDGFNDDSSGFSATSNGVFIGEGAGLDNRSIYGLFTNISGLAGATVNVSYITARMRNNGAAVKSTIYADDAAAPVSPTTAGDYTGRTTTTAGIAWDDQVQAAYAFVNSPSINTVIQELATSYDPSSILILWKNNATGATNYYQISTYEGSAVWALQLHIEYTAAAAGGAIVKQLQESNLGADLFNGTLIG